MGIRSAVICGLIFSTSALAASSSGFSGVPSRFRTQELTLGSRGLGEICYARDVMPDGSICNPAYLPEVTESMVLARVFVGNGYSALNSADQFVNKPLTREYLQSLFQKQNTTSVESNIGLNFTTQYFQAAFSPYRVQYASEVHNPNNPVVAAHAAVERAFVFSSGTNLSGLFPGMQDFSVGGKLRILERKFVHGTFTLLDVATREPNDVLPVKKQNAILFDPAVAWVPVGNPWKLRVSFGAKNLGYSSEDYYEYPDDPDLEGGVGMEVPVGLGRLRLGMDFSDLIYAEELKDRFRVGASYLVGMTEFMVGGNSNSITTGLSFLLSVVQASLVYEVSRDDLENGKQETRIATEVSIRF